MFLAIRDGTIVERSNDIESLLKLDPMTHEVVEWSKPLPSWDPESGEARLDPRSPAEKAADAGRRYKRRRLHAMPSVRECLTMIYHDMKNGTTGYVDTIDEIHEQFPKPE